MEWVKLAIDLLKTVAWPVVVLILGLRSRPLLRRLVNRIKRIKAGGNEIELGVDDIPKQLEPPRKPQQEQKALPPPRNNAPPQLEPEQPAPAEPDLVVYAPVGAVIQAWARLEETLRREANGTQSIGQVGQREQVA